MNIEYYSKIIGKSPVHACALQECMEELEAVPHFSDADRDLRIHYAHTWAPVFTEFTDWVLIDAKKRGIEELYFLSRDAYPMFRIAKILNKGGSPDIHYLRVSRYALRIPEMAINKETFLDYLFVSGIDVTMSKILRRGALTEEEIEDAARIIGFDKPMDMILSFPEIMKWKEKASRHLEELWALVHIHARKLLPPAIGYLRQEGMLGGKKMAIVDSGWVGTTQQTLGRLLNIERPGTKLQGYYFGLYEIPDGADIDDYHTFYFAPWRNIKRKVFFSNSLFEAVSSENAGMTLLYERWGKMKSDGDETGSAVDTYEPVLNDGKNLNSQFLSTVEEVMITYAETYCRSLEHLNNNSFISAKILSGLMARPDKWEAMVYGNLKFCDDVLETYAQNIAADLTYEDIRNLRLSRKLPIWMKKRLGKTAPTLHESGWIYGSIVKCGKNVRWSLFSARLYQWVMYIRKALF